VSGPSNVETVRTGVPDRGLVTVVDDADVGVPGPILAV
jgi:hypothetical protein